MQVLPLVGVLIAFIGFALAVPATNHIPAAITQAAAGNSDVSDPEANSPDSPLHTFNTRFQVPGTGTVLWISEGRKIDPIALRILFARTQLDLNDEIAKYGLDAVPGLYDAPKYDFWTRTPSGTEGYFVITALSTERMTYRLVNETLAGLKIFSIDQGRNEQVTFEVEDVEHIEAFGGFSIGPQAEAMQALSNDTTSLASDPASLTALTDIELRLQCNFGRHIHPAIISYLLSDVQGEVQEKIQSQGIKGLLPGVAGEYEKDGHRGAVFRIDGLAPAHLTWQITIGVVATLKAILVGDHVPREATCRMVLGSDVVGLTSVKMKVLGADEQ